VTTATVDFGLAHAFAVSGELGMHGGALHRHDGPTDSRTFEQWLLSPVPGDSGTGVRRCLLLRNLAFVAMTKWFRIRNHLALPDGDWLKAFEMHTKRSERYSDSKMPVKVDDRYLGWSDSRKLPCGVGCLVSKV
jgi:hypothetical protein